ncbi:hypothetical protein ACVNHC_16950 [Pannonibacter sp. Q-1]|uniref:FlgN protein n=2 Tax=Stappiaceae TaxID=2821832 RepID=A0A0U3Q1A2_9HYPH|nr:MULTISPECIES: hypothetical protein [Pannonibacter]ALV26329.1 hypothetical protein APZ00_03950 [Pannonibacter phragmitetus]MBA4205137.1 hypothetical protein [Polymorphum sp.]
MELQPDMSDEENAEITSPEPLPVYVNDTLIMAIIKAHTVVEAETEALREQGTADLRAFEFRKSQALLELARASRTLLAPGGDGARDVAVATELRRLRAALEANMQVLSLHLDAVREIAGMISQAMLEADSDGTYSLDHARVRP